MTAAASKILTSILGALLSTIGPRLLETALSKVQITIPSMKGMIHVDELEKSILKNLGYSSVPALIIGFLTYVSAHDGEYIKNSSLAYFASLALGLIIDTIRKAYAGFDPSLAVGAARSFAPATLPGSEAVALAETANLPIEEAAFPRPCPPGPCMFAGRIVEPPQV